MRARALALLFAPLLIASTGGFHHWTAGLRGTFPADQDLVFLPRTRVIGASSLGHRQLAADLIFLRTLLYFSTQLAKAKNYDWLERHLDAVNELDPDFRAPYVFGIRATMYNGNTITNQMVFASTHFGEAGLLRFPRDWELAFAVGCNYIFELDTNDPKQKEKWRRIGVGYVRRAALHGGPAWLSGVASRIMTQDGETDAAIRYLEETYLTARDEPTREHVRRLLVAKHKGNLGRLIAAQEAFNSGWQAAAPYAPSDFYVLLGDPQSPRLDAAHLTANEVIEAQEREARDQEDRDRAAR
ncbi:MAG: hypothetical protein EXR72_19520 [Myxococcales bacterium]|nr:hypothetical protein [Myxococcales bacterium]